MSKESVKKEVFVEYGLDFDNNRYGFGRSVEVEYEDGTEIRTKDKYNLKNRNNFKVVFGYGGDLIK